MVSFCAGDRIGHGVRTPLIGCIVMGHMDELVWEGGYHIGHTGMRRNWSYWNGEEELVILEWGGGYHMVRNPSADWRSG